MAKRARGTGSLTRKKGSPYLYLSFSYYNSPIVKSTHDIDNENNRIKWTEWLDEQHKKIIEGNFVFTEAVPGASEEEKKRFTELEGKNYTPEMKNITFEAIEKGWEKDVLPTKLEERRVQVLAFVKRHILPIFGKLTFNEIKRHDVIKFINELKLNNEIRFNQFGKPASPKLKNEVLGALRSIWDYGCAKNNWLVVSPCDIDPPKHSDSQRAKGVHYTEVLDPQFIIDNPDWSKTEKEFVKRRRVIRFAEWERLCSYLGWAELVIKFMLLTGTIYSEVASLQWYHVTDKKIIIRQSYHSKTQKICPYTKSKSRIRDIDITDAIRSVLTAVKGDRNVDVNSFIFTSPGDILLKYEPLEWAWKKAVRSAGLIPLCMYCLRHSFIAWCLTIGVEKIRVVSLAGHSSRKMVDENYGHYVEKLVEDKKYIAKFFGEDFHKLE